MLNDFWLSIEMVHKDMHLQIGNTMFMYNFIHISKVVFGFNFLVIRIGPGWEFWDV